jgi:outer membrane immunogenic protein
MAADMAVKAPLYKAPPPVALGWTGFYVGGSVGVRAAEVDATGTNLLIDGVPFAAFRPASCPAGCVFTQPMNSIAARGSLHGGYNLQVLPNALIGVEADWGWANRTTTLNGANYPFSAGGGAAFGMTGRAGDSFAVGARWDASLRGRIGWLPNPSVLLYATGGAAWLNIRSSSTCSQSNGVGDCAGNVYLPTTVAHATTRTGWTAGGGLEAMLAPNWIARAEYRYADFGTASFSDTRTSTLFGGSTAVASYDLRVRTHTALFGVSYLFGGPVVARY